MKNYMYFVLIFILFVGLISLFIKLDKSVFAANGNSTSDLQLVARAINGEARGEPYEGQVAVRCSNNE